MSFVFASAIPVAGQKTNLAGTWKLDRSKPGLSEYSLLLVDLNVLIKGDSLLTKRTYATGEGQEYPFTENVTLDGKECKITIYDMPRKSKAVWSEPDGVLNLESTTTYNGSNGSEDFISKEVWKVDNANKTLTISFKNSSSAGQSDGAFIYNKVQ